MRVLLVGSGGREHALAWKLRQSTKVTALTVAPGNAGTVTLATNASVPSTDVEGIVRLARDFKADLAVIGPEAPLALGVVDKLQAVGVPAFGPTQKAARIESSKSFAKAFM